MKKNVLFILLCSFFALSCSVDDDSIEDYQQLLPVDNVIIPQTVEVGVAEDQSSLLRAQFPVPSSPIPSRM